MDLATVELVMSSLQIAKKKNCLYFFIFYKLFIHEEKYCSYLGYKLQTHNISIEDNINNYKASTSKLE